MASGISGSFNVTSSNKYISGIVYYSETYDVAANKSNVTVTFKMWRNNDYSGNTKNGAASSFKLWCNGVSHTVNIAAKGLTIPPGGTKVTVGSYTFTNLAHNNDGSKAVNVAVEGALINCGSAGKIAISLQYRSVTLTKIKRLSSLSTSDGTLGESQNITVTRQDSNYTHTITAKCGNASEIITTKSNATSITFAPPINWAAQNISGTSVSVTFIIETFYGSTSLGNTTKTITCSIPSYIKPSVLISTIDPTGYADAYGKPIKGKSTLQIDLSVTLGGSSPINNYLITANGESYTSASALTSQIKGDVTIKATVTDKRGRTDSAIKNIAVFDYNAPTISSLTVRRCNLNGDNNDRGEYIKVSFSGSVTPLDSKNTAIWKVQYKKSSDSSYTTTTISELNNHYSVTNNDYIFLADTGSSYDVRVYIKDDFEELYRTTAASTALTIMHYKSNGKGMSIGKISELDNVLDIGFQTRFYGGIRYMEITSGTNLNDLIIPNMYICSSENTNTLINCPVTNYSFRLEIQALGEVVSNNKKILQLKQIITVASSSNPITYERIQITNSEWEEWKPFNPRGSFIYVSGLGTEETGYSRQTISSINTWENVNLKKIYSSGNAGNSNLFPFQVKDDGTIICNFPGVVALSGSIRASTGLKAADRLAIRIALTRSNNTNLFGGVWEDTCYGDNKQTSINTPTLLTNAIPGDEFNLQVRNQDHAGATLVLSDCTLTAFYI